jgi:hypothetical protein
VELGWMLSAFEFKKRFFEESDDLEKIKLAIREERVFIWTRKDQENLGLEFLQPILDLPPGHPIQRKPRESGGPGDPEVVIMKYEYEEFGEKSQIYMKAFYSFDGGIDVELEVQSLRKVNRLSFKKGGESG